MNRLPHEKRTQIIHCLCEGMSIRAIERITGISKTTILKLIPEIGKACVDYQNRVMRNLSCKRIQIDEIWAFCHAKQKNLPEELKGQYGYGDVWTWVAIDADTKLIPYWMVGPRDMGTCQMLVNGLANRLKHRIQISTNGLGLYAVAVEAAFGSEVDFAQVHKL